MSFPRASRPETAACLALLPLIAWAYLPANDQLGWRERVYLPQATMLTIVAIAALIATWRRRATRHTPASTLAAVAGLTAAIAAARSPDPHFALQYLSVLVALAALACWVRTSRCTPVAVVAAVVLAVLSLAAYAAAEATGLVPWLSDPGLGPGATLGNRNALARCAAMALPGAWWLAAVAKPPRGRVWVLAAGLLLGVVIASRCRVAWLACLVAAAVALALLATSASDRPAGPHRVLTASLQTLVVATLCAYLASRSLAWSEQAWFASTASRLVNLGAGSGAVRAAQARALGSLILQHPVLGTGPVPLVTLGLSSNAGGYNTFASSDVTGIIGAVGALPVLLLALAIGTHLHAVVRRTHTLRMVPVWSTIAAMVVCAAGDTTLQLPFPGAVAVAAVVAWLPRASRARTTNRTAASVILMRACTLILLSMSLIASADTLLGVIAVSRDARVVRLLPRSLRAPERRSIAELRRAWVRAATGHAGLQSRP